MGKLLSKLFGKEEASPAVEYYGLPEDLPALAPESVDGHDLAYHYKDVTVIPLPAFSIGNIGTRKCGIKRGDPLTFRFEVGNYYGPEDKDNIAVYWRNTKIGDMRRNRMREMVHKWAAKNLPIFCAVAEPRENNEIIIEFGFYGKPGRSHEHL